MSLTLKLVALTAPFFAPLVRRWLDAYELLIDQGVLCIHAAPSEQCVECAAESEELAELYGCTRFENIMDALDYCKSR